MAHANRNAQQEHLYAKYIGTGHADTTKYEWVTQQQRDTYASYLGHASLPLFFACARNQSVGRVRYELVQQMVRPCGPPPVDDSDDDVDGVMDDE